MVVDHCTLDFGAGLIERNVSAGVEFARAATLPSEGSMAVGGELSCFHGALGFHDGDVVRVSVDPAKDLEVAWLWKRLRNFPTRSRPIQPSPHRAAQSRSTHFLDLIQWLDRARLRDERGKVQSHPRPQSNLSTIECSST
jgi:hypothetical protein